MKDSLSELYPIEFILTCKKCELIVNAIREQSLEPRTSDLYWIFKGKMSHRTLDKHVKELVSQGYLRRFVGNFSGEISFLLLPDQIYIDMMEKDPSRKWEFVKNSEMFVSDCKILYENWEDILSFKCPNCNKKELTPHYEDVVPQEKKYKNRRVKGEINWTCDLCDFTHTTPIRTF
ncbi:hypothetical protein SE19_02775 [Acidiplasma aeolicum]|uniref:Uncharacterized protein n=1 Tax=Acidiplasma aeolicum TaxID=507754 RepID=A0A0Q0RWW4_9ARCH|nr:hypothetical protein [Acidiplasma aeolicum]KPV47037.1 hypothetical protein SE19_02775 [Acidiplasma aeolicum]KQB34393.1 hypothetical protein AOG54_01025 [Acidiplasma aeolicum]